VPRHAGPEEFASDWSKSLLATCSVHPAVHASFLSLTLFALPPTSHDVLHARHISQPIGPSCSVECGTDSCSVHTRQQQHLRSPFRFVLHHCTIADVRPEATRRLRSSQGRGGGATAMHHRRSAIKGVGRPLCRTNRLPSGQAWGRLSWS